MGGQRRAIGLRALLGGTLATGALGLAFVAATASPLGHGDVAALLSDAKVPDRWIAHLDAGASLTVARSDHRIETVDRPLVDRVAFRPATTDAAPKGDAKFTRLARVETPGSRHGAVFALNHVFAPQDESALPRTGFAADAAPARLAFDRSGATRSLGTLMAMGTPATSSTAGSEPSAATTLVAYAPAEDAIEAPFAALMGEGAASKGPAASESLGLPRIRPTRPVLAIVAPTETPEIALPRADETPAASAPSVKPPAAADAPAVEEKPKNWSLLDWLTGRRKNTTQKGLHAWAKAPLPKSVYTKAEQHCLAVGIYFEARGEPVMGQAAVAQVILNRVKNPTYPDSICGVVYQNKHWRNRCQFSFTCDNKRDVVRSPAAWSTAVKVASDVTYGRTYLAKVADSTHYHATYVKPRWASALIKADKVGRHIFYRTKNGGWS